MKRINLRDYYPFYTSDFFIEVTDEIAALLIQFKREEHADHERRRVHRAYYSLELMMVSKGMLSCWCCPQRKSIAGNSVSRNCMQPSAVYPKNRQSEFMPIFSWVSARRRLPGSKA